MEQIQSIIFDINISPSDIHNINLKQYLQTIYKNVLYKGIYVKQINKITNYKCGKILSNGNICMNICSLCEVIDLHLNEEYEISISNSNKLGAFYNNNKINIFIPKQYCLEQNIPNGDDVITVKIIGKRIEQNISCIGEQIISNK